MITKVLKELLEPIDVPHSTLYSDDLTEYRKLQKEYQKILKPDVIEQIERMIELKSKLLPDVYLFTAKERAGEPSLRGKLVWIEENGNKRHISVYVGKSSEFTKDVDNKEAIVIAQHKARKKLYELYP